MKRFNPSRDSRLRYEAVLVLTALCLPICASMQGQQKAVTTAASPVVPNQPSVESLDGTPQLDRAVAIVNGDLILDSDIDKEVRFQELNFDPGLTADLSTIAAPNREEALERLINRQLILQQLHLQDEPPMSDEVVNNQIELLRQTLPGCAKHACETEAGWNRYLNSKGFTAASFRESWREGLQVLSFVEERFKSGIRIDPKLISDYYEKTMVPRYKAAQVQAPQLDKVSDRIREILIERQVSKLLNDWLQTLRAQGGVVILQPGQAAP